MYPPPPADICGQGRRARASLPARAALGIVPSRGEEEKRLLHSQPAQASAAPPRGRKAPGKLLRAAPLHSEGANRGGHVRLGHSCCAAHPGPERRKASQAFLRRLGRAERAPPRGILARARLQTSSGPTSSGPARHCPPRPLLTSFLRASRMRVFSCPRLSLMRARRLFSMMGLEDWKEERGEEARASQPRGAARGGRAGRRARAGETYLPVVGSRPGLVRRGVHAGRGSSHWRRGALLHQVGGHPGPGLAEGAPPAAPYARLAPHARAQTRRDGTALTRSGASRGACPARPGPQNPGRLPAWRPLFIACAARERLV